MNVKTENRRFFGRWFGLVLTILMSTVQTLRNKTRFCIEMRYVFCNYVVVVFSLTEATDLTSKSRGIDIPGSPGFPDSSA